MATAWIIRMEAGGLDFVMRPREPTGALPKGPAIAGVIGAERFAMVLPDALVAAMLEQAPEPLAWENLTPEDAALVLECLMGDVFKALEDRLGLPTSLECIIPTAGVTDGQALTFEILVPGASYPCAAFLSGREPRGRLAQELLRIVDLGPAIMPGALLAVGPIELGVDELGDLEPGDTIVIEGATTEALQGEFLFADGSGRPVRIESGSAVIIDAELITPVQMSRRGCVELLVGTASAPVSPEIGAAVPFRSFEDGRVRLRSAGQVIAFGELVESDGRIGLSITTLEAGR